MGGSGVAKPPLPSRRSMRCNPRNREYVNGKSSWLVQDAAGQPTSVSRAQQPWSIDEAVGVERRPAIARESLVCFRTSPVAIDQGLSAKVEILSDRIRARSWRVAP